MSTQLKDTQHASQSLQELWNQRNVEDSYDEHTYMARTPIETAAFPKTRKGILRTCSWPCVVMKPVHVARQRNRYMGLGAYAKTWTSSVLGWTSGVSKKKARNYALKWRTKKTLLTFWMHFRSGWFNSSQNSNTVLMKAVHKQHLRTAGCHGLDISLHCINIGTLNTLDKFGLCHLQLLQ